MKLDVIITNSVMMLTFRVARNWSILQIVLLNKAFKVDMCCNSHAMMMTSELFP